MKYVKPAVVKSGKTHEPVEAGCCLRSCGGAPRASDRAIKNPDQSKKPSIGTRPVNTLQGRAIKKSDQSKKPRSR